MDDSDLIYNIKNERMTDKSLNELYQRHSGIYCRMINSYIPEGASFADRQELIDDAKYHIYCAALKYDESKNTKFSTFLGNTTRWMCLNKYNKSKKEGSFSNREEDFNNLSSEESHFVDCMMNKELVDKIFESIQGTGDQRAYDIFTMRYIIGHKNKVMPWRQIGKKMNLSIQGCINIHDSFVKKIKSKNIK